MNDNEKNICTGACLFGKCPNKVCVRYLQKEKNAVQIKSDMNILTANLLPGIASDKSGYGVAVDIGTTTVVAYLYDSASASMISCASRLNSQASFGVDVISRIKYCSDYEKGLSILNEAIISDVNSLLGELTIKSGITAKQIAHMVITGNTTMLHLFARLSPVSMGALPFKPYSRFGKHYDSAELGLNLDNARVYLAPCISAFVGGDITSAVIASGMFEGDEFCALLDIGTNGEVAIGNKYGIYATSTAAGPAFEGAHIRCGMAGVSGAISSVEAYKGKIEVTTIGNQPEKGICGSGLLDAVALALGAGLIDDTGRIADKKDVIENLRSYLVEVDGQPALKISPGIVITQKDIREVQAAKAAIAAGLLALLHHTGRELKDLDTIYLAGGFGNFMKAQSAMRIGLLPKAAQAKVRAIGNAAGTGAIMAMLSDKYVQMGECIAKAAEHIELGHNPYFMEKYIENMFF